MILDLANNLAIGTKFTVPVHAIESRKQWLFAAPITGHITVDDGAEQALTIQHKSLLPAGIRLVEEHFTLVANGAVTKPTRQTFSQSNGAL